MYKILHIPTAKIVYETIPYGIDILDMDMIDLDMDNCIECDDGVQMAPIIFKTYEYAEQYLKEQSILHITKAEGILYTASLPKSIAYNEINLNHFEIIEV